jgi:hypothetical protein
MKVMVLVFACSLCAATFPCLDLKCRDDEETYVRACIYPIGFNSDWHGRYLEPSASGFRSRACPKLPSPQLAFSRKPKNRGATCFSAIQPPLTWYAGIRVLCIKLLGCDIAAVIILQGSHQHCVLHLFFHTLDCRPFVAMSSSVDKNEIQYIDEREESIDSPKPHQIVKIDNFQVLGLAPEDADFYINYTEEQRKRVIHKVRDSRYVLSRASY